MHNTLESHRFFPYIAWTLVIGFAVFTYALTMQVQGELAGISDGVDRVEMRLENLEKNQTYQ